MAITATVKPLIIPAQVELDHERGVVYVNFTQDAIDAWGMVTFIRIQGLASPIPKEMIDVTLNHRSSTFGEKGE